MRIAVSGTHFVGKSTLIEDFIQKHPEYKTQQEPYYQLQDEQPIEFSLEPSVESFIEQLDRSIEQLNDCADIENFILDRCPIDFLAYAMCALDQDSIDIHDSEIAERFAEIKDALDQLDLIVFIPLTNEIEYTEENPEYRQTADKYFKNLYRDEVCDVFPRFNHPRIVEITGDREKRVRILESYL